MSTNYYWHDRPCTTCSRYDRVHVGKSSNGFLFRAWPHTLLHVDHPDWGYGRESPFGYPITSRADWRRVFTDRPGELWNEYGDRIDNPVAWLDDLIPGDSAWSPTRRHRDAEGFTVMEEEFS